MSDLKFVSSEHAPKAIGPYSQAVIANGFLFSAGQVPFDPATMEIVGTDIKTQTARVMENLQAILAAAGSSFGKVVKTTVYLASMDDFAAMNEVYTRAFGSHKPARSTVAVKTLPRNALVEIDVIAAL